MLLFSLILEIGMKIGFENYCYMYLYVFREPWEERVHVCVQMPTYMCLKSCKGLDSALGPPPVLSQP